MKKNLAKIKSGFTLIEMLVVIVIIIVLAGLVFRMSRPAGDVALRAQCVSELELMKTLIEEYHSEFGAYPPVKQVGDYQPIGYVFPDINGVAMDRIDQTEKFTFGLFSFFVGPASIIDEFESNRGYKDSILTKMGSSSDKKVNKTPLGKRWLEDGKDIITDGGRKVVDVQKVKGFANRVRPDLNRLMKVARRGVVEPSVCQYNGDEDKYTNMCVTVSDPWGREYVYISKKPYTTYLLFSKGPDGKYDVDDPEDRSSEYNKDNIYGDIGNN